MHLFGKHKSTLMGVDIDHKALTEDSPAINRDVEVAAANYEKLEAKLDTLLTALKSQHTAMKESNARNLETVKIFEEFSKDTPLERVVGPAVDTTRVESEHGAEKKIPDMQQRGIPEVQLPQDNKSQENKVKHLENPPGLVEERIDTPGDASSEASSGKDEKEKDKDEDDKEEENDKQDLESDNEHKDDDNKSQKSDEEDEDAKVSDGSQDKADEESNADSDDDEKSLKQKDKIKDIPESMAHPFEPISDMDLDKKMKDTPFSEIHRSVYVESSASLDEYMDQFVQYMESWNKVNRTRIKAGLYEFNEMSEKLEHYQKKMEWLDAEKDQERYERNQQKLLGALEAHTSYSEKLLRYMEEATERGWKDFYPLLLNAMEFHLSYAAGQFKYCANLKDIIQTLKNIGEEHGLYQHGRLQELESEPLGDVYTGERGTNPKPCYLVGYPGEKSTTSAGSQ